MEQDEDIRGDRGGDTGETKQQEHGKRAEKGDVRRENMGNQGPTHSSAERRAQGEKDRASGGE